MTFIICLVIVILPVSAIAWGMLQGLADPVISDDSGTLEMNENGIYELRIL